MTMSSIFSLNHILNCLRMSYLLQSPAFLFSQYMIVSTNITNTDIFKFIAVLVFKLFSHQVFFIKTKDNSSREKMRYFLKKQQISRVNYCKIINSQNAKFSRYFEICQRLFLSAFLIFMVVPLRIQFPQWWFLKKHLLNACEIKRFGPLSLQSAELYYVLLAFLC